MASTFSFFYECCTQKNRNLPLKNDNNFKHKSTGEIKMKSETTQILLTVLFFSIFLFIFDFWLTPPWNPIRYCVTVLIFSIVYAGGKYWLIARKNNK